MRGRASKRNPVTHRYQIFSHLVIFRGIVTSLNSLLFEQFLFRRVHLLRPYTMVENILMPTAIEQRGIHLVLPVLRNDTKRLDDFFQMYQKVCLQTGENVVLLTVFVNVRDAGQEKNKGDIFADGKAIISR